MLMLWYRILERKCWLRVLLSKRMLKIADFKQWCPKFDKVLLHFPSYLSLSPSPFPPSPSSSHTGFWSGTWCSWDQHSPEGDHPPTEVLQDEQLMCRHPHLCHLQVERLQTFTPCWFKVRGHCMHFVSRRLPWYKSYSCVLEHTIFPCSCVPCWFRKSVKLKICSSGRVQSIVVLS